MGKIKKGFGSIGQFFVKHKIIFIVISILLVLVLGGFVAYNYLFLPRIELKGSKKITIDYKEEYVEKGYSANYMDKDVTDDVEVKGKVNSNKLGEYEVSYTVKKGPFKKTVTRTVKVVDKSAPVIKISEEKRIVMCPNAEFKKEEYTAVDNYDGDITSKVEVSVEDNKAIYKVSDKAGNTTKVEKELVYEDKVAPILTLNGSDVVYAFVNEGYSEKGFSAADNCIGDISNRVKVIGSVNTSVSGTYTLKYEVSDDAGNTTTKERKVIVSQRGQNGVIYLTFDDGPREGTTNVILDILKAEGIKATFFVTSSGPDYLIKRMHDEGHTVALHTASHNYATVYASVDSYFNDLYTVGARVKRITGIDSKIIRFPGGSSNTISRKYCSGIMSTLTKEVLNRGYKYYDWNVSSGDADSSSVTSSYVYNNTVRGLKKNRSNMVLMHDIKAATRDALKSIIQYGKDNGYSFEKITIDTEMVTQRVNN